MKKTPFCTTKRRIVTLLTSALFCSPAMALAQVSPAAAAPSAPASPQISYVNGQLAIHALNASLTDVLAKVSALLGVSLDLPEGATSEVMPVVVLGPGPAREVLASLLGGAHFDYMMQATEADSAKLQSVLILPRRKSGSEAAGSDALSVPSRSPYARTAQPSPEPEVEAAAVSAPLVTPAADSNGANPPAPITQPDSSSSAAASAQRDSSAFPKSGQLSPPATLTPQSMNGQLQQMYQQRMQITQQQRPAAGPAAQ